MHTTQHFEQDAVLAALEIAKLMDALDASWGAERMSIRTSEAIMLAIITLLESEQLRDHPRALHSLCHFAQTASRMWVEAKAQLRLVHMTAIRLNIALPSSIEQIIHEWERTMTRDEVLRYDSTQLTRRMSLQTSAASVESVDNMSQGWEHPGPSE